MNWPKNIFTKRLGISIPLIQAPMAGGITTPELIAAVANGGALGSLGAGLMQPEELRATIRQVRQLTSLPFNVNLFILDTTHQVYSTDPFIQRLKIFESKVGFKVTSSVRWPPSFEKQIEVLIEEKVSIFSFTFGIPPLSIIADLRKLKTVIIGSATCLEEALCLQEANVDFIVCQGKEAGGHRGSFKGTLPLEPTIDLVSAVRELVDIPLIAAGGIMHGKDVLAALEAGAVAVQMGTAFLTCRQSGAHSAYKWALLEWKERKTTLTKSFTGKWARAVENEFTKTMGNFNEVDIPPYPIAQSLTAPMRQAAAATNNPEFMSIWAGENFHHCCIGSAQDVIDHLKSDLSITEDL